jgi:hypothetical protein
MYSKGYSKGGNCLPPILSLASTQTLRLTFCHIQYLQPDKTTFRKSGVNDIHNLQELALGNPDTIEQSSVKQRSSIKIYAKIK